MHTYTYVYLHILTCTYIYLYIPKYICIYLHSELFRSAVVFCGLLWCFSFYSLHYTDACTFCGASRSLLRQVSKFCSWQPPGALFWSLKFPRLRCLLSFTSTPFKPHFGPLLVLNFDPFGPFFDVHVGHTDALHQHFLGAWHLLVIHPSQMHLG